MIASSISSIFSAIASTLVEINFLSSSDTSLKQNRKQQKLARQIEELAAKDDLTLIEAYKLSKLMEKNIAESDSTRSSQKKERKVRK